MLNSLFIKHEDRKEAAAIERRRQYEEERKARIFNARQRVIGVRIFIPSASSFPYLQYSYRSIQLP